MAAFAAALSSCAFGEPALVHAAPRDDRSASARSEPDGAPAAVRAARAAPPASHAPSPASAPPTSSGSAPAQDERALRHAFAARVAGDDAPGLRLASFLVSSERFEEALHVLDMALGPRRSSSVLVARAGVLRDLARNDLAMLDLEEVVRRRGRAGVTAGTLFELAQVQWLAGATKEAAKTMDDMLRVHVDSDFLALNRARVDDWHVRVQRPEGLVDSGDLRDAFALLRAAPQVTARLQMLDALASDVMDGEERRDVRLRAIAVACGDPSAAVRTRSVQLAAAAGIAAPAFWRAAVADADGMVRRAAASACVVLGRRELGTLLIAALEVEPDPDVFLALHRSLGKLLHVPPISCDPHHDEDRQRAVLHWRRTCAN